MRYLILDAHYGSTGIKSLIEGYLNKKELRLSYHLWAEIIDWRDDYASTLLMPSKKIEKASSLKKIDELDKKGIELIKKLLDELEFAVKIQYYSEGRQCLFPTVYKKEKIKDNPFLEKKHDIRYLVLDADYNSTGIRDEFDEFDGSLEQDDLGISDRLWDEITEWVLDYVPIILMGIDEIVSPSSLKKIYELDKRGVALIQQLLDELECNVKIRYYSEGMLGYLSYYKANPSLFGKPYVNEFHNKVFSNIKNE